MGNSAGAGTKAAAHVLEAKANVTHSLRPLPRLSDPVMLPLGLALDQFGKFTYVT